LLSYAKVRETLGQREVVPFPERQVVLAESVVVWRGIGSAALRCLEALDLSPFRSDPRRLRLRPKGEKVMMRALKWLSLSFIVLLASASQVYAADGRATMDEAKAMALKAAQYLKDNGLEKSVTEFMNQTGNFKDRDLYVALYDRSGNCLAHGATPGLVGKNLIDLKDVEGKPFARIAFGSSEPVWVDYKWPNPVTKQVEQKSTYVVPIDNMVVTVGAYKQ
jgi:hypothetical protein